MRYAVSKSGILVGNASLLTLENSISVAQIFGVTEAAITEDELYSAAMTTNTNAAQTFYWCIAVQDDLGTSTLNGSIRVLLEYDVKFFDPAQFSLSAHRPGLTPTGGGAAAAALPVADSQCCRIDGCQRATSKQPGGPPGG
jgi:hypothetical protein